MANGQRFSVNFNHRRGRKESANYEICADVQDQGRTGKREGTRVPKKGIGARKQVRKRPVGTSSRKKSSRHPLVGEATHEEYVAERGPEMYGYHQSRWKSILSSLSTAHKDDTQVS